MNGLIGYTGFVGSTLQRQATFEQLYNSKNISDIAGQEFDLLVCAGAPAEKWKANKEPEADRANLTGLMQHLASCRAQRLLLISTVDVYSERGGVDESHTINKVGLHPYGLHRLELEEFCVQQFSTVNVVRLPALFGVGLKKNFIFDLLNNNCLDWTDHRSTFQFYDLSRLWNDLQQTVQLNLSLVNFVTAPVKVSEIAQRCFDQPFTNETQNGPVHYALKSKYADRFGGQDGYLYDADESYARIRAYVQLMKQSS